MRGMLPGMTIFSTTEIFPVYKVLASTDVATTIVCQCITCGTTTSIIIPAKEWEAWDRGIGLHIQDAMPSVSSDLRELILSSVCGTCFDAMFDTGDDEEEYSDVE